MSGKILSACNRIVDKVRANPVNYETYKDEQYTNGLLGSKVACIIGYKNFWIHEHMNNNDQFWGSRAYEHQVLTHVIVKSIPQWLTVRNLKSVISSAYIDQDG